MRFFTRLLLSYIINTSRTGNENGRSGTPLRAGTGRGVTPRTAHHHAALRTEFNQLMSSRPFKTSQGLLTTCWSGRFPPVPQLASGPGDARCNSAMLRSQASPVPCPALAASFAFPSLRLCKSQTRATLPCPQGQQSALGSLPRPERPRP